MLKKSSFFFNELSGPAFCFPIPKANDLALQTYRNIATFNNYIALPKKNLDLPLMTTQLQTLFPEYEIKNSEKNKLGHSDRKFHDWYRFVLSYPPHLVKKYLTEFGLTKNDIVLDPFCGTGTTLVEAKLQNIPSIGIEANPFAHFASSVKIDWQVDGNKLLTIANEIREASIRELEKQCITDVPSMNNLTNKSLRQLTIDQEKLILKNSLSPLPLHKCLNLLDMINNYKHTQYYKYFALAFANSAVFQFSNLRFGPEIGVGKLKQDAAVVSLWFKQILKIAKDLNQANQLNNDKVKTKVILNDSRDLKEILEGCKISAVITSSLS